MLQMFPVEGIYEGRPALKLWPMKIVTRHFEVYIVTAVDILNVTSQPLITLTLTSTIKGFYIWVPKP